MIFNFLFKPVDNSPLILFRQLFGLLIMIHCWGALITGWVTRFYIVPEYHFSFIGFEWLRPLPGNGMIYYFLIMGFLGFMILRGIFYRYSISLFLLMWTVAYLTQKTSSGDYHYLVILTGIIMLIVPANASRSWDVQKERVSFRHACAAWCIRIFIFQLGIIFLFSGLSKLNSDWLSTIPVDIWFQSKADYPVVGNLLQNNWFKRIIVYGSIAFDFLIFPALIWRKTRIIAFLFLVISSIFNALIYQTGVLPFLLLIFSVFFFEGETIRSIFFKRKPKPHLETERKQIARKPLITIFLVLYLLIQLILPLRHYFYPGWAQWNGEGKRMSWLTTKMIKTGYITFVVINNRTNESWRIKTELLITESQTKKVAISPDFTWQFVQILKKYYRDKGISDISIFTYGKASLNGRILQPIIDAETDLAKEKWERFEHSDWIVPLLE